MTTNTKQFPSCQNQQAYTVDHVESDLVTLMICVVQYIGVIAYA